MTIAALPAGPQQPCLLASRSECVQVHHNLLLQASSALIDVLFLTWTRGHLLLLLQAWGLSELKAGNVWAAVRLLERCVAMDPAMSPVLRWQSVERARRNVMAASAARPRRAQSGCAISSSHSSGCSTADGSSSSNGTSTSCLSGGS